MRIAPIHTSDRGLYKVCRRRWHWGSHMRRGLETFSRASPLWFGSGIHYALENTHWPFDDTREFKTGAEAFNAYVAESLNVMRERVPPDWKELWEMGKGMMDYYENEWLVQRDPLPTYVHNGVPQLEVMFEIELPIPPEALEAAEYEKVVYRGTIDRISYDPFLNGLWVVEYKTAAQFQTMHFLNDPQCTAYVWAATYLYELPVLGVIYQQHLKAVPEGVRFLANGTISSDARQNTSHRRYRQGLIDSYGVNYAKAAPAKNIECLNKLAMMEDDMRDPYVRRDKVYRNQHQIDSESVKIMLEVMEMINPDTSMYPHAGRHCSMCNFQSPCTSLDDGSDFETELQDERLYVKRGMESNLWKSTVLHKSHQPLARQAVLLPQQLQSLLQSQASQFLALP